MPTTRTLAILCICGLIVATLAILNVIDIDPMAGGGAPVMGMIIENKGVWVRSKSYTYSSGGSDIIDTTMLNQFMTSMAAPEIAEVKIHANGNISAAGGAFNGEDAYKYLSRIQLKDLGGYFYDLPGSLHRIVEQVEYGDSQVDHADLASGSSDTDYDQLWRINFEPRRAHRPADYRVPLLHLIDGGEMKLHYGNPANDSITGNLTFYVWFRLVDNRQRELKARMKYSDQGISATDFNYPVNGSVRTAFISSDLASSAGYTALSLATYDGITSRTLEWADLGTKLLQDEWLTKRLARASDDEFLASTPNAIMLLPPDQEQAIGRMPNLSFLHLILDAAPASGRLVTCVVEDRHPTLGWKWMGFENEADYVAALHERGVVKSLGGAPKLAGAGYWDPKLARRLPMRLVSPAEAKAMREARRSKMAA